MTSEDDILYQAIGIEPVQAHPQARAVARWAAPELAKVLPTDIGVCFRKIVVEASSGARSFYYCRDMALIANTTRTTVEGAFNTHEIVANPGDTVEDVHDRLERLMNDASA